MSRASEATERSETRCPTLQRPALRPVFAQLIYKVVHWTVSTIQRVWKCESVWWQAVIDHRSGVRTESENHKSFYFLGFTVGDFIGKKRKSPVLSGQMMTIIREKISFHLISHSFFISKLLLLLKMLYRDKALLELHYPEEGLFGALERQETSAKRNECSKLWIPPKVSDWNHSEAMCETLSYLESLCGEQWKVP